jgi:hypothetical protein
MFRSGFGLKSEIIHIGKVDDIERLAGIFGCRVVVLTMKYLGLPLGAPYKTIAIWNSIVEKKEKAVGGLEAAIFVEGREVNVDQKYFVQFTHLLSIFVSHSFGCGE